VIQMPDLCRNTLKLIHIIDGKTPTIIKFLSVSLLHYSVFLHYKPTIM